MKYFLVIATALAMQGACYSQQTKKIVFGSFVFEQQVFQYQYKRDGNIHSLKLSTLAQPDPTVGFDDEKFLRTEAFLKDATQVDSSKKAKDKSAYLKNATQGILDTIAMLPKYIEQLKNVKNSRAVWIEQSKSIDKLIEIFENYKIEEVPIADTLAKDIYSAKELLAIYKTFLQNVSDPQATQEIPFPELKQQEFGEIFYKGLSQLYLVKNQKLDKLRESALDKATDIMYEIKARTDFKDDEPITAYMNLKRKFIEINFKVPVRNSATRKRADKDAVIAVRFEIKNVIVEFEDGGIKNIFTDLQPLVKEYEQLYGNNTIRFRNNKPISITGKFDPDKFRVKRIYAGNTHELMTTLFEEAKRQKPDSIFYKADFSLNEAPGAYFILSNVLDYKVVSETDNEDYSPTNSKIELSEPSSIVELKKEKRSKVLSARAYTDFMGLSDNQPNGLVQIEVSKKINIVPGKTQGFIGLGSKNVTGIYSGGLAYIEPRFTLSKIEENNRYLTLDSMQLDKTKSFSDSTNHFLLSPLEVLRYQQWSFGLDINLVKLNLHNRKSNFQINASFAYGRVSAADSIRITQNKITQLQSQNISKISTTTYGIGVMYEVKPDSRYGLSLGYDFKWMDVVNPLFSYNDMFTNKYHSAWFNGFIKVNDDSKLFWRFRKNWLPKNEKHNFYQIQLGYELDIFKAAK